MPQRFDMRAGSPRIESASRQAEPGLPLPTSEPADPSAVEPCLIPLLPEGILPDKAPAPEWLDIYIRYAGQVSPMTPRLFHESAALWMTGVVVARRIHLAMPWGNVYPNLMVAWIAPTTLFCKSTALDLARTQALRLFSFLMTAQETTVEAFISDLAGRAPSGLADCSTPVRMRWEKRRNFAAQQGWMLDEMSGLLASAGKDYNTGLMEAILLFYDCTERYTRSTRGQGILEIDNACLSFLGASTPSMLAEYLQAPRLWAMGFWPRCALLTPEQEYPVWKMPEAVPEPLEISDFLSRLLLRLPEPTYPTPPQSIAASFAPGMIEVWENYCRVLRHDLLIKNEINELLSGAYGRLPTQALKIALLLAVMEWEPEEPAPVIRCRHLAHAMHIAESWRHSLHRTFALGHQNEFNRLRRRVLKQISRQQPHGATLRDICRQMQDKKPDEIQDVLRQLLNAGEVEERSPKPEGRGRPTTRYFLAQR
ncbi:MAG: DUF3987 domain-containing protein [Armatimonadetes bacterium]|nr:DUF3987 domain-containing protein [Armatimonadota bacterium]